MYKCRLTYDEWNCIVSKSRIGKQVNLPRIKGYLGLLTIHSVSEKEVWKYNKKDVVVCDNGYHWLTIMPSDAFYCMTVMMDDRYQIKVCYIDMIDTQGYDDDEVPYFYDLYLDLIVYPNGDIITDDMDELQKALETSEITKLQYDKAITASQKLQCGLLSDMCKFQDYVREMLHILEISLPQKKYTLEVCADSVESAVIAAQAGADRLELCSNLIIGGTTPTQALFSQVRKKCDLRIHVLIRPRFGDFCYTEDELAIILEEIKAFRSLGVDGIVIGALTPDGELDCNELEKMRRCAGDIWITLHRAFDMCRDPYTAMEQAYQLGINCILTSGQSDNCMEGAECIRSLIRQSAGKIQIMAGGGIDAEVIRKMHENTGASAYHMSGKKVLDSPMRYRRENVHMGLPGISEYDIWRCDAEKIREAADVLRNFF